MMSIKFASLFSSVLTLTQHNPQPCCVLCVLRVSQEEIIFPLQITAPFLHF